MTKLLDPGIYEVVQPYNIIRSAQIQSEAESQITTTTTTTTALMATTTTSTSAAESQIPTTTTTTAALRKATNTSTTVSNSFASCAAPSLLWLASGILLQMRWLP